MGCFRHRQKRVELRAEQKWDYINLQDFKSKGCGTPLAYGYLWFSLILSIAVYSVDTFTAFNLLAFDRWSSQIQPKISMNISKWIFSACIIASIINLAYEYIRATRVMRRGTIAESYLDPLAVRWQSIRPGDGQGWRRFLVFAELTKNKKGGEYVALFAYFSFQSWIRVLICSGPRQAVNAITLWSAYDATVSTRNGAGQSPVIVFFQKLQTLAQKDYQQTLVLSGMLFTLVVWICSLLMIIAALVSYIFFLWHWIPRADGGLTGYCERKVNQAVLKIVSVKVSRALARGNVFDLKAGSMAALKHGHIRPLVRTATLPDIPDLACLPSEKLFGMPMLRRNDTMTTLPLYTSRPGTPATPTLAGTPIWREADVLRNHTASAQASLNLHHTQPTPLYALQLPESRLSETGTSPSTRLDSLNLCSAGNSNRLVLQNDSSSRFAACPPWQGFANHVPISEGRPSSPAPPSYSSQNAPLHSRVPYSPTSSGVWYPSAHSKTTSPVSSLGDSVLPLHHNVPGLTPSGLPYITPTDDYYRTHATTEDSRLRRHDCDVNFDVEGYADGRILQLDGGSSTKQNVDKVAGFYRFR